MQEQIINNFIDSMLEEAGLAGMPDDFKKDYAEKIRLEIEQDLGRAAVHVLKKEDLKDFRKLIQKPDFTADELMQFFNEHIPDFPSFLQKELSKFKQEFVEQAKKMEEIQKQQD